MKHIYLFTMVRTRFAPSPTGYVHIASLQKILYSYAMAKSKGGKYIVRIEDTDQNRYVEGAEEAIFDAHKLLGIDVDESPFHPGEFGPYRQSERLEIYKSYTEELIEKGYAYYAFETAEELQQMRESQTSQGLRPHYDGTYRDYPIDDAKNRIEVGEKAVVRIKIPKGREIIIDDMIMGKIKFNTNDVDDYVIMKSDGFPTYHLAVVVDDHLMQISHIFRGVEWISTSPVHYLLYEYFGWKMPDIAHIPNILDPNGGKLSKRNGSVALLDFLKEGYLPEAIINFIILLGWSPSNIERIHGQPEREMFTLPEFVELFQAKDLNKSNPVFNRDKLIWFNKEYLKKLDSDGLSEKFFSWIDKFSPEHKLFEQIKSDVLLSEKLKLVQARAKTLSEVLEQISFFYTRPSDIKWDLGKLSSSEAKENIAKILKDIYSLLKSFDADSSTWQHEDWEKGMRAIGDKFGAKHGDIFMILRMAIVGSPFSPSLFESLLLLGRDEVLQRLETCMNE